ncbi:MAG TPA: hypothetical protein VFL30_06595, partial [Rhodanobacteraceae bacterium]|nr:hypothetical protein [Rhodanobacteraceae bacterium]
MLEVRGNSRSLFIAFRERLVQIKQLLLPLLERAIARGYLVALLVDAVAQVVRGLLAFRELAPKLGEIALVGLEQMTLILGLLLALMQQLMLLLELLLALMQRDLEGSSRRTVVVAILLDAVAQRICVARQSGDLLFVAGDVLLLQL